MMKLFIKNLGIETTLEKFIKEWHLDIDEVNQGLEDYGYFGEFCSIVKDDDNRIIGNINTDSWEVIGYVNESYNNEYFYVVRDVYDGDDCYTIFYVEEPISDEVSGIYFKGDTYREKTILSDEEISHFHNLVDEGEIELDVSYQEKWFVKKEDLIKKGWKKTIESFNLYDWDTYKFEDGDKNGKCEREISYHENGNIKSEKNFLNGKEHGRTKIYFESGNIKTIYDNINGQVENLCTHYFESGNIESEINFKNSQRNGLYTQFYDTGEVFYKGEFINDLQEGLWEMFYENGKLKKVNNFINGNITSKTCWDIDGNTIECEDM